MLGEGEQSSSRKLRQDSCGLEQRRLVSTLDLQSSHIDRIRFVLTRVVAEIVFSEGQGQHRKVGMA